MPPSFRAFVVVATIAAAAAPATAQPSISARVIDGATGKPLARAPITRADGTVLARTDKDGRFTIAELAPATTLCVLADRSEPSSFTAGDGDGTALALLPEGLVGESIEVASEAPPSAPGATALDRTEVETLPGARGDLIASL